MIVDIDRVWRKAHPLPSIDAGDDKNSRGPLVLAGGSRLVPGGLKLTAEAALRVGASKVRMATVETCAIALGISMPECGMVALPETADGEIAAGAAPLLVGQLGRCRTLILGPAMGGSGDAQTLVRDTLAEPREGLSILLDAGALTACSGLEEFIRRHGGRVVLTPHHGEMGGLMDRDIEDISADPASAAIEAASRFDAVVVLKAARTFVATPGGQLLHHDSDCPGLATGGSGDVLAGIIGGLLARGADPLVAAGWGVWLHASAGNAVAQRFGPTGFLARDLLPTLPRLLAAHDTIS